jgi:hypothetical protein
VASSIETVEANIVTLLQGITYFDPTMSSDPGTVRGVSDIKTFLDLTTVPPPAAIIVFDGEKAKHEEVIGASIQQTTFFWSIFLMAASFGGQNENRVQIYQMIDDVVDALEGQLVGPIPTMSKLFYVGSARYQVLDTAVVYESRWRHQFVRTGA